MRKMSNKAIFLDRDGTINIDYGYVYKSENFKFIDGSLEALKMLKEAGYLLIIITNQSGIARGYFSERDFERLTLYMKKMMEKNGVEIDKVYYCPHLEGCECRKPKLKLFYNAINDFDIDLDNSFAIGDKLRDLNICYETATRGFLISQEKIQSDSKIKICNSLLDAARQITKN